MKEIIKVIIALVFIIGSYLIGSSIAKEECKGNLTALYLQLKDKSQILKELQDSLNLTKRQLIDCTSKKADTLKVQFIESEIFKKRKEK